MTTQKNIPKKRLKGALNEALPPIRLGTRAGNFVLGTLCHEDTPWHETEEEVEQALKESCERRKLIKALMPIMREHLTAAEFEAMQLHFLHGKSYRQMGVIMDRNASTALRYVQRAIKKLRAHLGASGDGEIPFMQ